MNRIDHLAFSFKYSDRLPYFSSDYEMSEWIQQVILPVIDKVFSSTVRENLHIVINELKVDLNGVSKQNFCDELPARLSNSLRKALKPYIENISDSNFSLEQQLLEFFNRPDNFSASQLIQQWNKLAAYRQHDKLKRLLIENLKNNGIQKTIAGHLPEKILHNILILLEPSHSDFLMMVLKHASIFNFIQQKNSHVKRSNNARIYQSLVVLILRFLSRGSTEQFRRKDFLLFVLHSQAKQQSLTYPEFLLSIYQRCINSTLPVKLCQDIVWIFTLSQSMKQSGYIGFSKNYVENCDRLQLIEIARIAIKQANWTLMRPYWNELSENYENELKSLLCEEGQNQRVRQYLASGLPEKFYIQLVKLLAPQQFTYIENNLQHSSIFFDIKNESQPAIETDQIALPDSHYRTLFKEFTLTYLLVERGSHFNKKSYLRSLIRQMSNRHSINYDLLLSNLHAAVISAKLSDEITTDLMEILDYSSEFTKQGSNESENSIQNRQTGYELYQSIQTIIEQAFLVAKKVDSDHWQQLIRQLDSNHPYHLQRLYRELQSDSNRFSRLCSVLDAKSLRLCILSFMRVTGHINTEKDLLLRGIDRFVEKAVNRLSFYKLLLFTLLHNCLIDLELIVKLSSSSAALRLPFEALLKNSQRTVLHQDSAENPGTDQQRPNSLISLIELATAHHLKLKIKVWNHQLEEVAAQDQLQLHHFYKVLQQHPDKLDQLFFAMESDSLLLTIRVYIQCIDDQHKSLLPDLDKHFSNPTHRLVFLQAVFSALLQKQKMNLQLLYEHTADPAVLQPGITAHPPQVADNGSIRTTEVDHLKKKIHSLIEESHVSIQSYQLIIDDLLAKPDQLRLLSQLPESLLYKLAALLRTGNIDETFKIAEILRLAVLALPLNLSVERVKRMHWHSLFQFLLVSNKSFRIDRFVQLYITLLYHYSNLGFEQLIQNISQQLVLCQPEIDNNELRFLCEVIESMTLQDVTHGQTLKQLNIVVIPSSQGVVHTGISSDIDSPENGLPNFDSELTMIEVQSKAKGIAVSNCGLVLISHYLPMLFERMGLISQGHFTSIAESHKAIHILHQLVYGNNSAMPHNRGLEKLLCGLKINARLAKAPVLKNSETELIDSLLLDLISQWKALGQTSIEGLRETFLQRHGMLIKLDDNSWKLIVESSTFDILLDRFPFGYSTIKHRFMSDLISVEWRSGGTR